MNYSDLNYSGHNSIQLSSEAVLESNLFLNCEVRREVAHQGLLCRCLFHMHSSIVLIFMALNSLHRFRWAKEAIHCSHLCEAIIESIF